VDGIGLPLLTACRNCSFIDLTEGFLSYREKKHKPAANSAVIKIISYSACVHSPRDPQRVQGAIVAATVSGTDRRGYRTVYNVKQS